MKVRITALVLAGILLYPLYPVFAQDPINTGTLDNRPAARIVGSPVRIASKTAEINTRIVDRKEDIASMEALFKIRLQKFKDQQKAQRVEKLNTMLKTVNSNRTSVMLNHLNTLKNILTKLESRVNEASQSGKDTSSAKTAIDNAKTTLESAKQVVLAQQQKDYTIQVSTEQQVKTDAKTARDNLFNDLKTTHDALLKTKDAVVQAIQTAVRTIGE